MSIARNLRRKQSRKEKHVIYWKDCNIPAKLFFDEVIKGNYHVLGKAPVEQLEKAYWSIIDEYVELDHNDALKDWFKRKERIAELHAVKDVINNCLYSLAYLTLSKEQILRVIMGLNSVEAISVNFDTEKPVKDEIERVQHQVIGELENEINIEEAGFKTTTENESQKYEAMLGTIQDIHGYWLPEDISLKMFLAKKHSAIEKSRPKPKVNG